jgi:hypothetical protein
MPKYNIFSGRNGISDVIAEALLYDKNQKYDWFTKDMYFQTFFYLSKRFGQHKIMDDLKDGGTWNFKVKEYTIQISLNSSWVTFIIFGEGSKKNKLSRNNFIIYSHRCPYWVKLWREQRKKSSLLLNLHVEKKTERELKIIKKLQDSFFKENGIDDSWTDERFQKEKSNSWYRYLEKYNNDILGVDMDFYNKNYGQDYKNAKTKHALKTLRQFLNNMMTPISVRDASYNIKGRCGNEFDKYVDNIKIEFIKK